jgi:hypothetical protein
MLYGPPAQKVPNRWQGKNTSESSGDSRPAKREPVAAVLPSAKQRKHSCTDKSIKAAEEDETDALVSA